jgi:hypothetical protein
VGWCGGKRRTCPRRATRGGGGGVVGRGSSGVCVLENSTVQEGWQGQGQGHGVGRWGWAVGAAWGGGRVGVDLVRARDRSLGVRWSGSRGNLKISAVGRVG